MINLSRTFGWILLIVMYISGNFQWWIRHQKKKLPFYKQYVYNLMLSIHYDRMYSIVISPKPNHLTIECFCHKESEFENVWILF